MEFENIELLTARGQTTKSNIDLITGNAPKITASGMWLSLATVRVRRNEERSLHKAKI